MGGGSSVWWDPPAPLQEVRNSGRKAQGGAWAWQAQGKEPVSRVGELADGSTGSEPAGTKHKIRPAH